MQKTSEQESIISSSANTLVVNAFAGTGKTTTLIDYAKARPKETFTYLAFNRAVKEEAIKKFPSNVRCVTTHGLAYKDFGSVYKDKLGQPKAASIAKIFKCNFAIAHAAVNTVTNYLCSPHEKLEFDKHMEKGILSNTMANIAFDLSKQLWTKMQDLSNPYIRMPHDGYLKLYQLSKPKINSNYIMVDEAQDSNMMVIDIVQRQLSKKLFIGDENQSIYGFRKAVDALNKVQADEKLYLTSSFRFSSGLANLATLLLKDWKGEQLSVKGLGKEKTVFSVNENEPHAILARTNSGLFDAAVKTLHSGNPFGYLGGTDGYRLDMILDAWHLKKGLNAKVTDQSILLFKSYPELEAYADTVDDKELKMLIRIIDKYKDDIPNLINKLKTKSITTLTGKEIILTTAHKSKGMEFNSVVLLDDYVDLKIEKDKKTGKEIYPHIEDINILYVAATRSIKNIKINEKTKEWLNELNIMSKVINGANIDDFSSQNYSKIIKSIVKK